MNKQDILNLTGLSEQEFYSQYPDQASFCNAYPDACNQMNTTMQMGGQQNQQQQLMQEISSMIKQGVNPKKILQQLVKIGMDAETAMQMIQAVAQQQSGQPSSETQQQEQMMYEDNDEMMDDSDMMEYGGIHINPKNKGKFTESANRAGMGVQEFASHVLANKEDYSSTQVKRANFARNAAKWKHEDGGDVYQNGGYYGYDGKYHKSKGSGTYNAGTYFAVGGEEQLASNIIAPAFNPFGFYDPNTNVDANPEVSPFTASPPSNLTAPQNNAIMINKNFTANDKVDSPIAPQVASTKPKKNKFGKTMGNIATGLDLGINLAGIASNIYDQTKQKKDFDKYMQSKMSTMGQYGALANTVNSSKGDYSVTGSTYGQFRPDQMGQFSNAGMYNGVYYPGMAMYGAEMMQVGGLAGASSEKYINRGTIPTPSQMMDMPIMAPVDNVGRAPYQTFNQESKPNFNSNNYVANPLPNPKGKDVATKLNNPGNMIYIPLFKKLFGASDSGIKQTDGKGTFAAFPTIEAGLKAREIQLFGESDGVFQSRYYNPDTDIDYALRRWSGGVNNDGTINNKGYGVNIYPELKGKTLSQITFEERRELTKRQIKNESGAMYKKLKEQGVFQYGGSMNQYGGQVLEMDENEIKQFLAAGGQLEFLD
jgi:hypothetical protein